MKLQSNSVLLRWAYLWADRGIPSQTDLCTVFWRSVVWTPLKLLLPTAIAVLFVLVLVKAARTVGWLALILQVAAIVGAAAGLIAACGGAIYSGGKAHTKAKTKGFCPIITVEQRGSKNV